MIVSKPKSSPSGDGPPQEVPASQARKPTLAPADGNPGDPERSFRLERSNGTWIDLPKKFLDEIYSNARGYYAEVPHMSAALRAAAYTTLRNWDVVGTTLREKPKGRLDDYLKARKADAGAGALGAGMARASTATTPDDVEAARHLWAEAKRSGDPDRMTRAANDLLRATERGRAASGAPAAAPPPAEGRHPISEILAPRPGPDAHETAQAPGNELPGGGAVRSDADVGQGDVAMGSEAHEHAAAPRANADAMPGSIATDGEAQVDTSDQHASQRASNAEMESDWRNDGGMAALSPEHARVTASLVMQAPEHQRAEILRQLGERFGEVVKKQVASLLLNSAPDPFEPMAFSADERSRLQYEEGYNDSPSLGWANPEPDAPYRIVNLLRRMGIDPRRWREFVNTEDRDDPDRRDWVDPSIGWSERQVTQNLLEMGRQGTVSVETLLMLSDAAYFGSYGKNDHGPDGQAMPDVFEKSGSFFGKGSDWERLCAIDDRQTGVRIFAIYNRRMRTVFIVNRGTVFSSKNLIADAEILNGEPSRVLDQVHDFMFTVQDKMREKGLSREQVLITGHSLGGAFAQLQVAVAHRDSRLQGMKVAAITFAALGARNAIFRHLYTRGLAFLSRDWTTLGESLS